MMRWIITPALLLALALGGLVWGSVLAQPVAVAPAVPVPTPAEDVATPEELVAELRDLARRTLDSSREQAHAMDDYLETTREAADGR